MGTLKSTIQWHFILVVSVSKIIFLSTCLGVSHILRVDLWIYKKKIVSKNIFLNSYVKQGMWPMFGVGFTSKARKSQLDSFFCGENLLLESMYFVIQFIAMLITELIPR